MGSPGRSPEQTPQFTRSPRISRGGEVIGFQAFTSWQKVSKSFRFKTQLRRTLGDESGILTLDFIFATILVFSFTAILFALSLTFTVSYVVQYMTYASSRLYFAAHINQDQQSQLAQQKFQELKTNPVIAPFFSNAWFELEEPKIGDHNRLYPQSEDPSVDSSTFWGTRVGFRAKILEMRIPYLGTTATEEGGFQAQLGSYLAREPTTVECVEDFSELRLEKIKELDSSYQQGSVRDYIPIYDNGC